MMMRHEIFVKVQDVLMSALFIDRSEINYEAALMADLGAASVDFLDIAFLLERKFGIKIRTRNFAPEDMFESGDLESGALTEEGMTKIEAGELKWVDRDRAKIGAEKERLFTVKSLCDWVEAALQQKEAVPA